ncbi:hypothetical protein FOMPIDRAFT_85689 [Fomitopsis schrenkii]|uniref:Cytochrome P450 n=1 Tax=Fomitopsis schrenkii TaxID=2126942 RepID=S8E9A0_FOMSC|nr:hypothetical protein FOMPIDRAFT_85689 [Fomitopsis schrenkii]
MSLLFSAYVSVVLGALYAIHAFFFDRPSRIHAIPTVGGPSLPLLSYIGAVRSLTKTMDIVQEGYTKMHSIRAAASNTPSWGTDVLSFKAAAIDFMQLRYTWGSDIAQNLYHLGTVRTHLMRNASRMFDDIRDEVVSAFIDEVQSTKGEHEWVRVGAADLAREVVCRVNNRVFVGLPICNNADYLAIQEAFTTNVFLASSFIKLFPEFMKPCVAQHNDLLQWLVETAPQGHERTVRALVFRVPAVNFSGLHTTSTIFTNTLHHLAAHPEHAAALREEVERIVRADGWSKASLGNMRLVDGFLKEVFRVDGLGAVSVNRIAVQYDAFADGTFIPKGTMVSVATHSLQLEADRYVDPAVFDPLRYEGQGGSPKDNSARTDDHYLVFGHGQHACSGRFFAVTVLKSMLAHIVATYDVKSPGGSRSIPPPMWIGASRLPNGKANVLFRKRDIFD